MRRARDGFVLACALGLLSTVAAPARANIDPVAAYDARVGGMGDTGAAYVRNATAIFYNPALLQSIDSLSVTFSVAAALPGVTHGSVPLDGPDTEVDSDITLVPSPFLGLGYRLSKRIVLGLAAYPLEAYGGAFKDVQTLGGNDITSVIATVESSPAVAVAVLDNLSLGFGYRITYIQQIVRSPTLIGDEFVTTETDLSGINFAGFHVGVNYRPVKSVSLGLSYRSKIETTIDGTVDTPGLPKQDLSAEVGSPHRFKAGVAYSLLGDRLLIALDMKMMLYEGSHEESVATLETPAGPLKQVQPLHWNNAVGLGIGAEYAVSPRVAVRAGYSASSSATPTETAGYFTPSPGALHVAHVGAGLRLDHWDFDLGMIYGVRKGYLVLPRSNRGEYGGPALSLALSGTYHK